MRRFTSLVGALIGALIGAMVLLLAGQALAQPQRPLTNNVVVEMLKAGFDERTIITAIDNSDPEFDTSAQSLIGLKSSGVSEPILAGMLAAMHRKEADARAAEARAAEMKTAEARAETAKAEAARAEAEQKIRAEMEAKAKAEAEKNKDLPDDLGVYVKVKGALQEVSPEVVEWRTGGVGKMMLTMGMTKGHINGTVRGPQSRARFGRPIELVIRCPEGVSVSEYQLLKLDEKKDRREFRALTGGIYHASSGPDKNAITFEFVKIAPRTYRVILSSLQTGEYGLLPPDSKTFGGFGGGVSGMPMQGGSLNSGKLYTFTILE